MGAIGGVILAVCQAPQLIKIFRTKSAADLSYIYMALYSIGLLFICIYVSRSGDMSLAVTFEMSSSKT